MIVLVQAVLLLWAQCERHSGRNLCSLYSVTEGKSCTASTCGHGGPLMPGCTGDARLHIDRVTALHYSCCSVSADRACSTYWGVQWHWHWVYHALVKLSERGQHEPAWVVPMSTRVLRGAPNKVECTRLAIGHGMLLEYDVVQAYATGYCSSRWTHTVRYGARVPPLW